MLRKHPQRSPIINQARLRSVTRSGVLQRLQLPRRGQPNGSRPVSPRKRVIGSASGATSTGLALLVFVGAVRDGTSRWLVIPPCGLEAVPESGIPLYRKGDPPDGRRRGGWLR